MTLNGSRLPESGRDLPAPGVATLPGATSRDGTPAGLSRRQTAVLGEMVRLLTPDHPELDEVARRATHDDVTRYLASQIQSMPSHLRLPYKLAIGVFDWLPLLRHLRRFVALPPASKLAYVGLWSDGPIGPMRDFVKLIRSSGLLVYYDHPRVVERLVAGSPPRSPGRMPVDPGSRR